MTATTTRALPPRPAVTGVVTGLVLMGVFTAFWSVLPAAAWPGPAGTAFTAVGIAVGLALLVQGAHLASRVRLFPELPPDGPDAERGRRIQQRFGLVFGAEGLVIGVVAGVLNGTGNGDWTVPAVALVVGLHFAPLARVFERRLDYVASAWLSGCAVLGLVAIGAGWLTPLHASGAVAVAAALTTAGYGIVMSRQAHLLRSSV